jgi:N-acetylglucosaminyldiphosphoundecaprenol N-acetyl-beta-D-mannosaminyltransferase
VSVLDANGVATTVAEAIRGRGGYVTVCNVHSVITSARDSELRQALLESIANTADGMPLVWALRLLGHRDAARVTGRELMVRMLDGQGYGLTRHFLLGSSEHVQQRLLMLIAKAFPSAAIVGRWVPPFSAEGPGLPESVGEAIRASGAQVVWVGLGCPRQEKWMLRHWRALAPAVLIGVGAAFDFLAGTEPVAPQWMQKLGLEWVLLKRTPGIFGRHFDTRKPVPNAGRGRLSWANASWTVRQAAALMGTCLSFRPDIMHLPLAHNRLGFLRDLCFVLCGRLVGARLVLQAHNDSYDKFVQLQGPLFRWLVRSTYRQSSVIAVPGASLHAQFDRLGLGDRVRILTNHLDTGAFGSAVPHGSPDGIYTVLLLGRVSFAKGAWDLVRAGLEAARCMGTRVRIAIAGEVVRTDESVSHIAHRSADVPELVADLLRQSPSGFLEVKYLGVLDYEAKVRALQEADVVALPSYSEALPYAILEGAAAGLPIIATEVGMVPELRAKGLRGEFIRPGDVGALAKAIVALRDHERRHADGQANRALAMREFDVSLLPERLTGVYREVMVHGAMVSATAR